MIAREVSRLKVAEASVREQDEVKRKTREERKRLRDEVEAAKNELNEIPDSVKTERMGVLMDKSSSFGKADVMITQKILRAERRLEKLTRERDAIKARFVRWCVLLGVAELVLVGSMVLAVGRARK